MGDGHRSSSSGWTRNMSNVRSFFGNMMGGLRGGSNVASWTVAATLAYFLWVSSPKISSSSSRKGWLLWQRQEHNLLLLNPKLNLNLNHKPRKLDQYTQTAAQNPATPRGYGGFASCIALRHRKLDSYMIQQQHRSLTSLGIEFLLPLDILCRPRAHYHHDHSLFSCWLI